MSLQKHDVTHATVMVQQKIFPCITSAALMCFKSMCYRRQAIKNSTSTAIPRPQFQKLLNLANAGAVLVNQMGSVLGLSAEGEFFVRCP